MPETNTVAEADYLLIARKSDWNSRRSRRFASMEQVEQAVERWRKEGFINWWLFAPRTDATPDESPRRLVRQWRD